MPRPVLIVALVLAPACGREVAFVDPPPAASSDTTGTDTVVVQRVDLEVTVTIAPADSALAARVGLTNGRLAGAQVTASRVAGQQSPQSGTTDSLGQLRLPGLLEGAWTITVVRRLTDAERARLDSANFDVTGLGGAGTFAVSDSEHEVTIEASLGRAGTLVISEAYVPIESTPGGYLLGQYVEVHNNSLDTLYLDGKVLGRVGAFVTDGSYFPCSSSLPWREDAEGIWTQRFWAFPGAGRTYPLAPGETVIVATDAIDHRVVNPGLLDLSNADFEFLGSNDVDNPAVPNMRNFPGWSEGGSDPIGHGPRWVAEIGIFLAEPFDPDSLVRDNLPLPSPLYVRVPRVKILDVLTSAPIPDQQTATYCGDSFVHPDFDRAYAELIDLTSLRRSILRWPVIGSLLQRTKASRADFYGGRPSPGEVP